MSLCAYTPKMIMSDCLLWSVTYDLSKGMYCCTFPTVANLVFFRIYLLANKRVYQTDLIHSHLFSVSLLLSLFYTFSSLFPVERQRGKGKTKDIGYFHCLT